MSKGWEKVQKRLADRQAALQSVHELSRQYYDALQRPMEWLPDAISDVDTLTSSAVTAAQPDVIAKQQARLQELEAELVEREAALDEGRELCRKLCDVSKEASTKFDRKSKRSSVERPFIELKKKIGELTQLNIVSVFSIGSSFCHTERMSFVCFAQTSVERSWTSPHATVIGCERHSATCASGSSTRTTPSTVPSQSQATLIVCSS